MGVRVCFDIYIFFLRQDTLDLGGLGPPTPPTPGLPQPPTPPAPPAPLAVPEDVAAVDDDPGPELPLPGADHKRWGAFTSYFKQNASKYGSWVAVCLFHRRSDVTGCQRMLKVGGPTEADTVICVNHLRHWCNRAREFDRQFLHLIMPLDDTPPYSVLVAQRIPFGDRPAVRVPSDAQLVRLVPDAEPVDDAVAPIVIAELDDDAPIARLLAPPPPPLAVEAAPAGKGRGRGRGRRGRGGRGGRGGRPGRVAMLADDPFEDSPRDATTSGSDSD